MDLEEKMSQRLEVKQKRKNHKGSWVTLVRKPEFLVDSSGKAEPGRIFWRKEWVIAECYWALTKPRAERCPVGWHHEGHRRP